MAVAVTIAHLAVVVFVQGACSVFFGLAERASIPRIVSVSMLPVALAQNEARSRGAGLAGPPLGGVLFGLGRAVPFLVDAVSYLFAAISLVFVRADLEPEREAAPASLWKETVEGLAWLRGQAFVRTAVLLIGASNLIFQALVLTFIVVVTDQGASSETTGVVLGVFGAGGLLGALVAPRLRGRLGPRTVIVGVNWVWAGLLPLLAVAPNPLLLGVVAAVSRFSDHYGT